MAETETTHPTNGAQLATRKLVKIYRRRRVVDEVSIEVNAGEVVVLLGPNGAGKTTTFYMITGFIRPEAGQVILQEKDITRRPMYRRARFGIGYLPQEASVFRRMTVADNITAILEMQRIPRKQRAERLAQLLADLNIEHIASSYGYQLSGGERRRVEIARALVTDPQFMLLDEPFAGIDPIAVEDIQDIIARLRERGLGILITDHNVRETLSITDRAYIMCDGQILTSGTSEFLASDPDARRVYLGEKFRL
jgi:lipopolysaccharide export system ATP-binding protein